MRVPGSEGAGREAAGCETATWEVTGCETAGCETAGCETVGWEEAGCETAGCDAAGCEAAGWEAAGLLGAVSGPRPVAGDAATQHEKTTSRSVLAPAAITVPCLLTGIKRRCIGLR